MILTVTLNAALDITYGTGSITLSDMNPVAREGSQAGGMLHARADR